MACSVLFQVIYRFSPQPCSPLMLTRSARRNFCTTMAFSVPSCMFQLKTDPLTGNSEWVVVQDCPGRNPPPPKSLLSSTSYLDMLNDSRRNKVFHEAINKTITKPCHVLDIGAGTGLLSMMAARAMESNTSLKCSSSGGMVSACESYLPMVKLMRKVLRLNGMEKKVRLFHKRSDELRVGVDLPSRADVLVSEILDSELLGEGLIPTLQHAHDELLSENPLVIPCRATIYGQLVQSSYLQSLHDLHGCEAHASDGIQLTPSSLETVISVKRQQYAMHCDSISDDLRLLSEPFKVFEFDFSKRPESQGETEFQIKTIVDGTVNAVISWWVLQLDHEGKLFYSTAPRWINAHSSGLDVQTDSSGDSNWCDHWKQCVWFIPRGGMPVFKDEHVFLQAVHSDTDISYKLRNAKLSRELVHELPEGSLILPPERTAIYGNKEWRSMMLTAARNALKGKSSPLCIVADDSLFWTILVASLSRTSNVISFLPGLREQGSLYLQAVAYANGYSMDQIKVLGRGTKVLTLDETNQRKVDLLVGEPFYSGNDGMLPWVNLRFWKERTILDSILSDEVVIMPCKGILKACAMSLPDLWRSRRCLKQIEGFDHSTVNETLGACGDCLDINEASCFPYFCWQCGETEELSEVVRVMEFNLSNPISSCSGKTKVRFTKTGVCHGFALWIDWVMDADSSIVLSTGPDQRYWKQGVKLLNSPVPVSAHRSSEVGESCSTEIEVIFDASTGELTVKSAFT
ncbi:protein arginine N-methyltransferase 7 [Aristolochia californica]|uniref:protein arginine N-methyltransferase 7 n=1 Tax=Aristolochia californica TaxID=171875 RepID=UPI0035DAE43F